MGRSSLLFAPCVPHAPLRPGSPAAAAATATATSAVSSRARSARRLTVTSGIRHDHKIRKDRERRGEPDPEELAEEYPDYTDLIAGIIPNPILALENGEAALSNLNRGAATAASYYYLQSHRNLEGDYLAPGVRPDPVVLPEEGGTPVDMFIPERFSPTKGLPPGVNPRLFLISLYGKERAPKKVENTRLILKAFIGVDDCHIYVVQNGVGVIAEANSKERAIGPYRGSRSIQCTQLLADLVIERLARNGIVGSIRNDVPLGERPALHLGRFVFEGEKVKRISRQRVKTITETLYKSGLRIGVDVDMWITDHAVRFDRAFYERLFEEYYMTGCADIISNFRLLIPGPKLKKKLKKAARKTFVARQLRSSLGEDIVIDEFDDDDEWRDPDALRTDQEDEDEFDEDDAAAIAEITGRRLDRTGDTKQLTQYFDAPSASAHVEIVDDSPENDSIEEMAHEFARTFEASDDDDVEELGFGDLPDMRDDELGRTRELGASDRFAGAAAFAEELKREQSHEDRAALSHVKGRSAPSSDDLDLTRFDDSSRVKMTDDLSSFFDD